VTRPLTLARIAFFLDSMRDGVVDLLDCVECSCSKSVREREEKGEQVKPSEQCQRCEGLAYFDWAINTWEEKR
jgi:hypothetical protein